MEVQPPSPDGSDVGAAEQDAASGVSSDGDVRHADASGMWTHSEVTSDDFLQEIFDKLYAPGGEAGLARLGGSELITADDKQDFFQRFNVKTFEEVVTLGQTDRRDNEGRVRELGRSSSPVRRGAVRSESTNASTPASGSSDVNAGRSAQGETGRSARAEHRGRANSRTDAISRSRSGSRARTPDGSAGPAGVVIHANLKAAYVQEAGAGNLRTLEKLANGIKVDAELRRPALSSLADLLARPTVRTLVVGLLRDSGPLRLKLAAYLATEDTTRSKSQRADLVRLIPTH